MNYPVLYFENFSFVSFLSGLFKYKLLINLSSNKYQIIDARSPDRFSGISEEPRPGMKSGHIPKSKNLYFNDLIDPDTKKFIKKEKIENLIKKVGIDIV